MRTASIIALWFIASLGLAAGCGDDDGSGAGTEDLAMGEADLAMPADLTVVPTIASIAITPGTAALLPGETRSLVATATYSDATTKDVTATATWTSSLPAVATVSSAGVVTAVVDGAANITAAQGGVTSPQTSVAVRSVTSVVISWPGGGVQPQAPISGSPLQLVATATLSDATMMVVTSDPRTVWSSTNLMVVTINGTGVAQPGTNGGTSDITATFQGKTGMTTMLVN